MHVRQLTLWPVAEAAVHVCHSSLPDGCVSGAAEAVLKYFHGMPASPIQLWLATCGASKVCCHSVSGTVHIHKSNVLPGSTNKDVLHTHF